MAKKYYTIQIFSSDGATAITRRISKNIITLLITAAGSVLLGLFALIGFYGRVYVKAMKVRNLEERNKYLESEFEKITLLEKDIAEIAKQREKLEVLLGINAKKETPDDALIKKPVIMSEGGDEESMPPPVEFETPEMEAYMAESKLKSRMVPSLTPAQGWITKRFDVIHKGVDIAAPTGTPIIATMDGTVESIRWDSIFGNIVEIKNPSGYRAFYGHCSTIYVRKGEIVRRGNIIAGVGQTGNAAAPHVHYEVSKDDHKVNPELFFLKGITK